MKEKILKEIQSYVSNSKFKKKFSSIAKEFENLTVDNILIQEFPKILTGRLRVNGSIYISSPHDLSYSKFLTSVTVPTKKIFSITENSVYDGSLLYHKAKRAMTDKVIAWLYEDNLITEKYNTDFSLCEYLTRWFIFDNFYPATGNSLENKGYCIDWNRTHAVVFGVENPQESIIGYKSISILLKTKKTDYQILIGYENEQGYNLKLNLLDNLNENKIIFNKEGGNNISLYKGLFGWKINQGLYKK